ncbi:conjugal transfer protein TraS, partial [Escherichia coli]
AKLQYVLYFAIVTNLLGGICFALNESGMIAFMGGSWFVTVIISTSIYNMMMAPYVTPAVTSSLLKMKELLSESRN